ncbi:hypothetical protein LXL04_017526 [Taraxacum kok-saghyz]
MGNCLKPVLESGQSHEEDEERKPLVISKVHDQVVLSTTADCCKKRKKVRFKVQADNAAAVGLETTMSSPRMKRCVRVKVVLTQSELKQILNRTTAYHHSTPPSFSIGQISGRIMMKCRRNRYIWNPVLQTIPELGHY